jgi:hypothetical protein
MGEVRALQEAADTIDNLKETKLPVDDTVSRFRMG